MYNKAVHLLVFALFMAFCQAYAQQSETIEPAQSGVAKDIQYVKEKGGELQDKIFNKIDSLSTKSINYLQTTTDSLSSLGSKLTFRIDSLQSQLLNKVDKLGNSVSGISGKTGLKGKSLPGLEKLSLPGMPNLNTDKLGLNNLSIPDNGISFLKSQVDGQLGKLGDLKNNDWINPDKSDYQMPGEVQEYGQLLKDPSNIDQTINSKAAQMSEFQTLNDQTKELTAMKALPESMLADLKRYQNAQALKAEAKEVAIKKATDYFANH